MIDFTRISLQGDRTQMTHLQVVGKVSSTVRSKISRV